MAPFHIYDMHVQPAAVDLHGVPQARENVRQIRQDDFRHPEACHDTAQKAGARAQLHDGARFRKRLRKVTQVAGKCQGAVPNSYTRVAGID